MYKRDTLPLFCINNRSISHNRLSEKLRFRSESFMQKGDKMSFFYMKITVGFLTIDRRISHNKNPENIAL